MYRLRGQIIILLLSSLIVACSVKTISSERIVPPSDFLNSEQTEIGDMISVYTNNEKEIIMYMSYYDNEQIVGYVTAIHDRRTDKFEFFDENDGITKNIKGIPFAEVTGIGMYERSTTTSPSEWVSKDLRCILEAGFFGFIPPHCYR